MASMLSKEWFSSISTNTFLMGNASLTLPLVIVSVLTHPRGSGHDLVADL